MVKIHEWNCPKCGKNITSLYEKQFTNNIKEHKRTHKGEKNEKNNGKTKKSKEST